MSEFLKQVNSPEDIKRLKPEQLNKLAKEIRKFLISSISKTGGHLSSNLGVVELTLAIHYCFDLPNDKVIWDVGHQAYVHKILTGRKDKFNTLRKLDGLSGFPKRNESKYDAFDTGHSSTSISVALGYAKARDLANQDYNVVAVIGDGSMTGGLAYEALNNAGRANTNLIVILNDNEMSISKNVGGMAKHLNDIRTAKTYLEIKNDLNTALSKIPKIGGKLNKFIERIKDDIKYILVPGGMFNELGFKYVGTIDGHNIKELIKVLNNAKRVKGPVLLHIHTKKGKGYKYAEMYPEKYHGVGSFNIKTGQPKSEKVEMTYSDIFGEAITKLADKYPKLVAITAAMKHGTGLDEFQKKYRNRFFDVGIAEAHAVTFAAGLAAAGYKPVFSVYSSFLQRSYDEIVHDICIQKLPVVFAIDRAGVVGSDGETHQGILDISFLSHIPNLTIMSPKNKFELEQMLEFAVNYNAPIAIRYPKGIATKNLDQFNKPIEYGKSEILKSGKDIAIIALGDMVEKAFEAVKILNQRGFNPMLINARFIKPIDIELLRSIAKKCNYIFTIENNILSGGFGSKILEALAENQINNLKVHRFAFPDKFIEQGNCDELFKRYKLDSESIANEIIKIFEATKSYMINSNHTNSRHFKKVND